MDTAQIDMFPRRTAACGLADCALRKTAHLDRVRLHLASERVLGKVVAGERLIRTLLAAFVIVIAVTGFFSIVDPAFARFALFCIAFGYWIVHLSSWVCGEACPMTAGRVSSRTRSAVAPARRVLFQPPSR